MAGRNIKSLGEAIQNVLKTYGLENNVKQYNVLQQWHDIVGEEISRVTSPQDVNEHVLHIKVKSMTWRTELQFHKMEILSKIEKRFGKNIIKDIRFY